MNPIMQMLGGNSNATLIMMEAIKAMMRGESPTDFLKNLAKSNPQLQGLDFDNLEGTAKDLCDKNNVDMDSLSRKIQEFANSK